MSAPTWTKESALLQLPAPQHGERHSSRVAVTHCLPGSHGTSGSASPSLTHAGPSELSARERSRFRARSPPVPRWPGAACGTPPSAAGPASVPAELASLGFLETGSSPGQVRHLDNVTDVVRRDVSTGVGRGGLCQGNVWAAGPQVRPGGGPTCPPAGAGQWPMCRKNQDTLR